MKEVKGTYILLGAAAGYISGGPIYHRNKAIYMQQQGWQVYYISCSYGKVYINGLEQFLLPPCTFIYKYAYLLPRNVLNKLIDYAIKQIPSVSRNIVIETGTDYTAYWGELFAERLKAKHIVIFLDEYNDNVTGKVAPYFKFKFDRHELACIQPITMHEIFGSFWDINDDDALAVPCYCTNSVEDFESPLTDKIVCSKYNIGYVGRLEKNAVPPLIDAVRQFAMENASDSISVIFFGGWTPDYEKKILHTFDDLENVTTFVSGFLFPIAKESLQKCDIYFSTAGSASVSLKAGVATVRIDQYTNLPIGFLHQVGNSKKTVCPYGDQIIDYLRWFFKEGYRPVIEPYNLLEDTKIMYNYFMQHDRFMESSSSELTYFNFESIHLSISERLRKILMSIGGQRFYKHSRPW